jgi:hypothetical protein
VAISRKEWIAQSIGRHCTIIKSKVTNAMSRQILNPISASVYTGFQKRSDFFQKRGDFIAFSTRLEIQGKLAVESQSDF